MNFILFNLSGISFNQDIYCKTHYKNLLVGVVQVQKETEVLGGGLSFSTSLLSFGMMRVVKRA